MLVAAVIFGGDTQTLAGQTIFFQFSIPIGVHFFNFSLQFFQICFFRIQKKKIALRAMSDLLLNRRASKFRFYLIQNTFAFIFYLFQLSILSIEFLSILLIPTFIFFYRTKVKTMILLIVLRIPIFHLRKFTCEFGCSSEPSEITFRQ